MELLNHFHEKLLQISFPYYQKKVRGYILRLTPEGSTQVLVLKRIQRVESELQVPGGTVDPGENYLHALNREIYEETGKRFEGAWRKVTTQLVDRPKRLTKQFEIAYYQFIAYKNVPSWRHVVTGAGSDKDAVFELSWVGIDEALLKLRPWMADHLAKCLVENEKNSTRFELGSWIRSRIAQSSSPQLP
jgi:8-oxo-dGTP pyrophosphatase MutT (NUDIX family)